MTRLKIVATLILAFGLALMTIPLIRVQSAPVISNINLAVTCNTSVLINFRTSVPAHAYVEYGTTTSYGSSTIDDAVRLYTEHAIQITGLSASTTYHFRVNVSDGSAAQ